MKTIMILGTSALQVPAIYKAKEFGYHVIGIDINPKSVGVNLCDEFYEISTMDKDMVLDLATEKRIDGIYTMATDISGPAPAGR